MLYNLPNNICWINCPLTNDFMVLSLYAVSASHRLSELVLTNVCENYPGWGGQGGILGIWSSKRSTERLEGGRGGAAEGGGYCHSNLYRSWALKSHVAWEGIRITMIRFLFYVFIPLAVLGLHCCAWALSSCSKRGFHHGGFSCGAQALGVRMRECMGFSSCSKRA